MPEAHLPVCAALGALPLALAGTGCVLVVMALLWVRQRQTQNAAIVDAGWAASIGALAILYAALLDGSPARRILVGAMVGLWSLRLVTHLVRERLGEREEEGRYKRLREYWGTRAQPWLLAFFLGQGLLAGLLALAFLPALQDARPAFDGFDIAGALLFVIALAGEALADHQLARFKADPDTKGKVCERGLWGWSRHPNYFFEWLLWIAFVLPGLPSDLGAWTVLAPTVMYVFVAKLTGVPTSEAQALRSRGDAYRDYQARVSVFFPFPPSQRGAS